MLFAEGQSFEALVFILCICSLFNSAADSSGCCVSGVLNWLLCYYVLLKQKLQVNSADLNIQLVVSRRSFYCFCLACVHFIP